MTRSKLFLPLLLAGSAAGLSACDLLDLGRSEKNEAGNAVAPADDRRQRACASNATYDRLKELVFDQAARIRNGGSAALDQLAAASIVRMERPVVRSRDEELNITTCTGHFILELPPGAENAFDGQRRLTADVRYSAQAAGDGSGLVYDMEGAEPIIYRLATAGMRPGARPAPPPAQPQPQQQQRQEAAPPRPAPPPAPPRPVRSPEVEPPPKARTPAPEPRPAPPQPKVEPEPAPPQQPRATASPSFNCARGRSRSERMVCSSPALAALDRQMSSLFYSALSGADAGTRTRLRQSRDRFLSFRERCGSEACVAQAYRDRMDEIRDMTRGR